MMRKSFGILRYTGSKAKAARDLWSLAPLSGVREYREVFAGSACMLAQIPTNIPRWINDIDPKVVKFLTRMRDDPTFVEDIIRLKETLVDATEIAHAFHDAKLGLFQGCDLAYLLLTRYAYGQIVGLHRSNIASFSFTHIRNGFTSITRERVIQDHRILQGVRITRLDYSELLDAPGEGCWIMADPPYDVLTHCSDLYGFVFTHDQQRELRDRLLACRHPFLLTIGITPAIEALYLTGRFNVKFRAYRYCSILRRRFIDTVIYSDDNPYYQPIRLEMIVRNYPS